MQNDLIANRYKPLFPRARGGFSDVIIAWDTRLARRVAIKRVNTGRSLPAESLEEARTAAMLSSPNIVNVYDFEYNHPETLIIMENVDGPSLAELMAGSSELLHIDVATTILDGIVSALEYAHENQVLHLDIKPANVLIDQSGHIKVSDFGLAELAGIDGFGEVQGGTIGYMPPEQLTGELVDVRTDVWALAALCYQLLTGINPFFALSPRESLGLIAQGSYALPSELRTSLSGGIDEALIRALSPQMDMRPLTIAEFWLELRPHLGKVGPGRRTLKSLVSVWAGKEAELLAGMNNQNDAAADADSDEGLDLSDFSDDAKHTPDDERIPIWNGDYPDEDDYGQDDYEDSEDAGYEKQRRAERRAQKKAARAARRPSEPLWQRLSPGGQSFIARCFCALAAASMAWLAMSSLPYLSDPLAQAATAAAVNTGNPAPSLLDAALIAQLLAMIIAGVVAFIVPRIGAAVAVVCLGMGFFFTGNWLVGIVVLLCCIIWWLSIGRHSLEDAAVFTLSPLFALISLPMLLPLLSGYFLHWRRALGTAALACFVCSLLSIVTTGIISSFFTSLLGIESTALYGQLSTIPLQDFLSISPVLMQMTDNNQLFIPLITLFTSLEFWCVFASWLGASVVMSLLNSGKSRVKYVIATLCGTGIVTAGYVVPTLFSSGTESVVLLAVIFVRIAIAFALCLLLIAVGVQPKPSQNGGKGRAR